ncbi:NADP-dependent oxidoreductase [Saccharopolyspora indica]|uniref:NADP-dependent oxidoreductase n=1 Tax=Saccharopolyspora indica TaxID=1229659 RepID=UPI0022EA1444|nr:NADP-dependent oxidoreductase [Saccharopolyspora indica]MDA3650080.1 NADP-dependent oxidoreductase [Saccharopolyspora indica]
MNDAQQNTGREIRLRSLPDGDLRAEDFELVETPVPQPGAGQVLVRNTWMSVDPFMRDRMDPAVAFLPPYQVGEVLDGPAIGRVIASEAAEVPVGTAVRHWLGWRECAVLDAAAVEVLDTSVAGEQDYLGPLGTTGLTAYVATTETAPVRPGDVVFVSAAAGAVGSVAGQLARQFGASKVIGSAGGPVKARKLRETFGFDAAIDYRSASIAEQLDVAAPDGIDVYIDNVGGEQLEAAIDAMRGGGRIALVGAISAHGAPASGPKNYFQMAIKEITMRGLIIGQHFDQFPEYIGKAANWLREGTLRTETTVEHGIERAPEALLGVLRGANTGKMLVHLDG